MANILYRKQKQQKSLDNGVTWIDTGEYRVGAILENPSNCTSEDSKQCRWVELPASEGYYCDGYNKYTVQVEECSENGIIWTRTGNQQRGNTLIESNSTDCGGWTEFDPVYFSCYLNNMKNATFEGEIVINGANNVIEYTEGYCDLNNNYLFGNSSNGIVIVNTKNGDLIKKDSAKCFIMDIEDTSGYEYSWFRETSAIAQYMRGVSTNIYKSIFIEYTGSTLIFQKFNGSGFNELYRLTPSTYFNFGYVRFLSTTNNYIYIWVQTFGVIRIDKGTLSCTKVTTDDELKKIPNELIKTVNDEVYYLATEYGGYQCYYYSGNTTGTTSIAYLNGTEIDFQPNYRISNYLIGNEYYRPSNTPYSGYSKKYINNNTIYNALTSIPDNYACMGDNTYIDLSYMNGDYVDFNDNTCKVNSNIFTKYIHNSLYSEKYKVLISFDGKIYDKNGLKESYMDLRCVFGYKILNHIYLNGVVEAADKYDDDCNAETNFNFYLITYNEIIKRIDDYLDSINFTTT